MTRNVSPSSEMKRVLRELSERAYREELSRELGVLYALFQAWQAGDRSPFEVNAAIHTFHQGPNRELFRFYTKAPRESVVARAVAEGLLPEASLPEALRTQLAPAIERERDALKRATEKQ
jgi:hypothetical protein